MSAGSMRSAERPKRQRLSRAISATSLPIISSRPSSRRLSASTSSGSASNASDMSTQCSAAACSYAHRTQKNLRRALRLPGVLRMAPIDAFEQHRQLRWTQMHRAAVRLRPHEASALQALEVQVHSIPAPPQEFDQITSTSAEHEYMPAEWIVLQRGLHLRGQRIHPTAHVGYARGQPYTRTARQGIHRCESASMTTRSTARSTTPVSRTPPSGKSISITPPVCLAEPLRAGELCAGTQACTSVPCGSITVTGSNPAAGLDLERASSRR